MQDELAQVAFVHPKRNFEQQTIKAVNKYTLANHLTLTKQDMQINNLEQALHFVLNKTILFNDDKVSKKLLHKTNKNLMLLQMDIITISAIMQIFYSIHQEQYNLILNTYRNLTKFLNLKSGINKEQH